MKTSNQIKRSVSSTTASSTTAIISDNKSWDRVLVPIFRKAWEVSIIVRQELHEKD